MGVGLEDIKKLRTMTGAGLGDCKKALAEANGNMEEAIRQLQAARPDCRIMVGGAVLTESYAQMIHAVRYTRDAMASVHFAQTVLG